MGNRGGEGIIHDESLRERMIEVFNKIVVRSGRRIRFEISLSLESDVPLL